MYNLKYCNEKQIKLLLKVGYPLTKVCVHNGHTPLWHTKDKTDKQLDICDAYYYPYLEEIAKWLITERDIYISATPVYSSNHFMFWGCYFQNNWSKDNGEHWEIFDEFDNPDDALSKGIDEALQILINRLEK